MGWSSIDIDHTEPVRVEARDVSNKPRIRVMFGQLTIRLDVSEAVDLVDAVVAALAQVAVDLPTVANERVEPKPITGTTGKGVEAGAVT